MSLFLALADFDVLATVCSAPKGDILAKFVFDSKRTSITRCNWRPNLSIRRLMMDRHAVYVGRRKAVPRICIVDGKWHSRKFLQEPLQEPGFTTRACPRVTAPALACAALPPVT